MRQKILVDLVDSTRVATISYHGCEMLYSYFDKRINDVRNKKKDNHASLNTNDTHAHSIPYQKIEPLHK